MTALLPMEHKTHVHLFGGGKGNVSVWMKAFPNAKFGVSGTLLKTAGNSDREEAVSRLELSKILLEYDASYLSPPGTTGPNHPWNIVAVAERVASLKGLNAALVLEASRINACRFLAWIPASCAACEQYTVGLIDMITNLYIV